MADNSWMLPPRLRYKQRKFGCKEAEMLMMCNNRSQEAQLQRRHQRLNACHQAFLRKYRHEVWEVRHFLRNLGRIERGNRVLLPTEKYEEDIFNAKLRAHNLRKRKRLERQQAEERTYPYETGTDDDASTLRLTDMMDRSLSLTASTLTRKKSAVPVLDPDDSSSPEPASPEPSRRLQRKGSTSQKKRRKKSEPSGKMTNPAPAPRRTPTNLDTIAEDVPSHPLIIPNSKEQLNRTLSTISHGDRELVSIVPLRSLDETGAMMQDNQKLVRLPKINTGDMSAIAI